MSMKVEIHCQNKRMKGIYVDESVRACINCIWYEQYFRKGRGNVVCWTPTGTGYCLLHDTQRGPLRQPCKEFETEKD